MAFDKQFDFVIVGGGLSGCVLAARLCEALPSLSVALLEAGPDESRNPTLHGTPLEYSYQSTPQPQIQDRKIPNWGGRLRKLFSPPLIDASSSQAEQSSFWK